MIRHGDPGDPDPAETNPPSEAHGNLPASLSDSSRRQLHRREYPGACRGSSGLRPIQPTIHILALNTYKWLVPNAEVHAPALDLRDLYSDEYFAG